MLPSLYLSWDLWTGYLTTITPLTNVRKREFLIKSLKPTSEANINEMSLEEQQVCRYPLPRCNVTSNVNSWLQSRTYSLSKSGRRSSPHLNLLYFHSNLFTCFYLDAPVKLKKSWHPSCMQSPNHRSFLYSNWIVSIYMALGCRVTDHRFNHRD